MRHPSRAATGAGRMSAAGARQRGGTGDYDVVDPPLHLQRQRAQAAPQAGRRRGCSGGAGAAASRRGQRRRQQATAARCAAAQQPYAAHSLRSVSPTCRDALRCAQMKTRRPLGATKASPFPRPRPRRWRHWHPWPRCHPRLFSACPEHRRHLLYLESPPLQRSLLPLASLASLLPLASLPLLAFQWPLASPLRLASQPRQAHRPRRPRPASRPRPEACLWPRRWGP